MFTLNSDQQGYVVREKLNYMYEFAKASSFATILAPILCIPLYDTEIDNWRFSVWFTLMFIAVALRLLIIRKIDLTKDIGHNIIKLNWGIGLTTFAWGLGWLLLIQHSTPLNYLSFEIISLTVLFVGMVGYCVNLWSFISFVLPLKLPEIIYVSLNYETIVWPIAAGSLVTFYLAIKMAVLFSRSWEKSVSLRHQNEFLVNQLLEEKNASVAANIAKSAFIATASHDLRQPMQAVNIYLELLNIKHLDAFVGSVINKIRISVDQLNKMFSRLLDISKLDAQTIVLTDKLFNALELADEASHLFEVQSQSKSLKLIFTCHSFYVCGDKTLLQQVLNNLLSNSIQYTTKGEIKVSLYDDVGFLTIEVCDTGCGIDLAEQDKIFSEFYRVPLTRPMHDGLGLGLSIVSRIIKLLDAELILDSTVGLGSTFKIKTKFPVDKNTNLALDGNKLGLPNHHPSHDTTWSPSLHELSFVPQIAIIEDDINLLQAYTNLFKSKGFKVHEFNGNLSDLDLNMIDIDHVDVILSDFRLNQFTGLEYIHKIREEFNKEIPALLLTADTSPIDIKAFDKLKIQVLFKPVTSEVIIDSVMKFLKQKTK
jgi:signal transduction histidine kinase